MDNKTARIALRKSIKHWCVDIRKPFLDGDSIISYRNCFNWGNSGLDVKMYVENCELCAKYKLDYTLCGSCPLALIDEACVDEHSAYYLFYDNLDIESANYMISKLIVCYKEMSY